MPQDKTNTARPRRPWLQFKLRTLLVLMLIATVPLWAFTARLQKVRRQRLAAAAINAAGGDVWFAADEASKSAAAPTGVASFRVSSRRLPSRARVASVPFDSQDPTGKGNPLSRLLAEARSGEPVVVDFSPLRFSVSPHGRIGVAPLDLRNAIEPQWRQQLRHLSALSRLEVLELDHAPIRGHGLAHLRSLRNLKLLSLHSRRWKTRG